MQDDLLNAATELMLLGMGTVFTFLAILVLATKLMSRVLASKFLQTAVPEVSSPSRRPNKAPLPALTSDLHRAIELAVQQYRKEHE